MYNFNKDLIYFIKREGTAQSPYNSIEENIYIMYEKAFLEEIPVQAFKVVAKIGNSTLTEVQRLEDVRNSSQYYVNYKQGIVYFHNSRNNALVNLKYKGQGVLLYPASRIYVDTDSGVGNITKTLKDLIEQGSDALNAVEIVSDILDRAETSISTIETLVVSVNEAVQTISEFTDSEAQRVSSENIRISSEQSRSSSEQSRISAELDRISYEIERDTAEQSRISAELSRQTKESERLNAESNRVYAEATRQDNEAIRESNENTRGSNETTRNNNENTRRANETSRQNAETDRINAEIARANAELQRQTNELNRQSTFNTSITNISALIDDAQQIITDTTTAKNETITATTNALELVDKMTFLDEYSSNTTYYKNNMVSYNGSSYIAKQTTNGNIPTNEVYWGKLAQRGVDGSGSVSSVNGMSPDLNGNVYLNAESLGAEMITRKGTAGGYVGLDSNGKIPISHIPDTLKQQTFVVLNTIERNALTNLTTGDKAYELSTGDSYIYDGQQWRVLADADWENVRLEWLNIIGKPSSSAENIDLAVSKSHNHVNKEILDGFAIINNRLQHNGANIGSVDSVNGMTGAVTINASSVGSYTKNEVDSITTEINNNVNSKISSSEKGIAGGIARLNTEGKVVDATGNEVEGKVKSVNGQTGNITGLETTASVDAKLANKVDKVTGKQLSTNDFTNEYKLRLDEFNDIIDELLSLVGDTGNIDAGIFPDISNASSINGGLFTSSFDEDDIDGGLFTSSFDEDDIDGGLF